MLYPPYFEILFFVSIVWNHVDKKIKISVK